MEENNRYRKTADAVTRADVILDVERTPNADRYATRNEKTEGVGDGPETAAQRRQRPPADKRLATVTRVDKTSARRRPKKGVPRWLLLSAGGLVGLAIIAVAVIVIVLRGGASTKVARRCGQPMIRM